MVSLDDSGKTAAAFSTADLKPANDVTDTDEFRYAGFWIRVVAYVIDVFLFDILALIAFLPVAVVLAFRGMSNGGQIDEGTVGLAMDVITLVGLVLYYGFFTASKWQATPGKRLLGLYIVGTDGRKLGFGLGVGRYLAYFLSSFVLGFGFFRIGWSTQKAGWHDIVCRTRVVYGRPRERSLAIEFV